jgi:hypothetical protein
VEKIKTKIKIRTKETFLSWVTLKPQRTGSFHERTDGLMVISFFHPKKKKKKKKNQRVKGVRYGPFGILRSHPLLLLFLINNF